MSKRDAGKATEREAGYIILGGLCVGLPPEVLAVRPTASELA